MKTTQPRRSPASASRHQVAPLILLRNYLDVEVHDGDDDLVVVSAKELLHVLQDMSAELEQCWGVRDDD